MGLFGERNELQEVIAMRVHFPAGSASPAHASRFAAAIGTLLLVAACSGGGGDGDGDETNGPTGPSSPSTPSGGSNAQFAGGWTGTTSQGRDIALLVTDNGIVLALVSTSVAGTSCTTGVTTFITREPPAQPIEVANGAFSIATSGSSGSLAVAGVLAASGTASGTITVNDTKCVGSLNATWTATRASGALVNLSGTWNGTFASSLVSRVPGVFTLTQNGATLNGSFNIPSNGATGTVAGTISGRMATFTFTQTTAGCSGTFTGHGVVMSNPEVLVYYYTGSDCLGAHTGGNGSATRP